MRQLWIGLLLFIASVYSETPLLKQSQLSVTSSSVNETVYATAYDSSSGIVSVATNSALRFGTFVNSCTTSKCYQIEFNELYAPNNAIVYATHVYTQG